jgi:hypothetical protein
MNALVMILLWVDCGLTMQIVHEPMLAGLARMDRASIYYNFLLLYIVLALDNFSPVNQPWMPVESKAQCTQKSVHTPGGVTIGHQWICAIGSLETHIPPQYQGLRVHRSDDFEAKCFRHIIASAGLS